MNSRKNVAITACHLEKEHHEDCLSCGEHIDHPLCPECIAKGFKQWLKRFPSEGQALREKVDEFLHQHKHLNGKSMKCASCGKHRTHICPYCFTDYLYKEVKEAGLGVRALVEFLFIFNFDFEHKGYARELDAMGGY